MADAVPPPPGPSSVEPPVCGPGRATAATSAYRQRSCHFSRLGHAASCGLSGGLRHAPRQPCIPATGGRDCGRCGCRPCSNCLPSGGASRRRRFLPCVGHDSDHGCLLTRCPAPAWPCCGRFELLLQARHTDTCVLRAWWWATSSGPGQAFVFSMGNVVAIVGRPAGLSPLFVVLCGRALA